MKLKQIFLLSVVAFLITSCASTYSIKSDFERGADFSSYKTFEILKQESEFPIGANPINKQRMERAILKEMNALYTNMSEEPDLLVSWFVKAKTVRDVDVYHKYYDQWRSRNWVRVYEYQQGTLVIDLIDRASNQVVWHGATSGRVHEGITDVEKEITQAVNTMMKRLAKDANLNKEISSN